MSVDTAVVLAAGEGTRLRPLTAHRPKPMLPAANRPILERVLEALVEAGVRTVHVVVGYRNDRVQDYFGPTYDGVPLHYHHQEKRLGTGHALSQVRGDLSGDFLMVNGDELLSAETVTRVTTAHRSNVVTLAVAEAEDAPQYGAVRVSGNRVTEFVEKPGSGDYRFLNAGVYAFDDRIFDAIAETPRRDGELELTDTISRLVEEEDDVRSVRTDATRVKANYPWDLLAVAQHLLRVGAVSEPESEAGVYVDGSARVHESAVLRPPVVVSADAVVGPNAVVGPDTALGRNVTVGANATVASSVVDVDSRVREGATLVDCVTGQSVRVAAGATVPGGPGDVRVGTTVHEDQDLGALLADRVRVGGGATLAPGTLVGPSARLGTGVVVEGVVDAGTEVTR